MYINQLILEIGRRCNLQCPHCLRGKAEDTTLNIRTAKKLINEFQGIGSITFTGGEPTLYTDEICKIIDYIIQEKKPIDSFYIATNGVKRDIKLLLKLAEFYGYIYNRVGNEVEYSEYDISTDQFHPPISDEDIGFYKAFSFVSYRSEIDDSVIINEGFAAENGIGRRNLKASYGFTYDEEEDMIDVLYLNAEGYLIPDCNYSYDTQRKLNPVKYGKKPLKNILKENPYIFGETS